MASKRKIMDPWIQRDDKSHNNMGHQYSIPPDPRPKKDANVGSGAKIEGGSTMNKGVPRGKGA
jgi:hypothetical protein